MASKKKVTKKAASKKVVKAKSGSKMEAATKLYQAGVERGLPRKAIIKDFMEKAQLTKAGASTYYQLIVKKLERS